MTDDAVPTRESCILCGAPFGYDFIAPCWRADGWESFRYGECSDCGSLSLIDAVAPGPFHRDSHFLFADREFASSSAARAIGMVAERSLLRSGRTTRWIGDRVPRPYWIMWFGGYGVRRSDPIVEVGSGSGAMLSHLARHGFSDLTGIDPYLPESLDYGPDCRIERADFTDLPPGEAKVCILRHSLEHSDVPAQLLEAAGRWLDAPGGIVVLELPIAEGPVWLEYRENWPGMDPPVHRFVPTRAGITRLAEAAGFQVDRVRRTCTPYMLWGSELVAKRISPLAPGALGEFSDRDRQRFKRKSQRLRRSGPLLTVVLRKSAGS